MVNEKNPHFICLLPISSNEDINGIAKIISDKLFGGIPFIGLDEHIYEEVPTVYIDYSILGLQGVIQGFGGDAGYTLEIRSHPSNIKPDDTDEVEIDITGYVSSLIEGTDNIQIKYEEINETTFIGLSPQIVDVQKSKQVNQGAEDLF